ncbi:MAG: hypothetical protein ACRD2G_04910, partial [Terriglobia bacterium]
RYLFADIAMRRPHHPSVAGGHAYSSGTAKNRSLLCGFPLKAIQMEGIPAFKWGRPASPVGIF